MPPSRGREVELLIRFFQGIVFLGVPRRGLQLRFSLLKNYRVIHFSVA